MDFNGEDRKISLSIKALNSAPAAEENPDVADVDIDAVAAAQEE